MKTDIIKGSVILLLTACATDFTMAQGYTPAALERLKEEKLWFHSSNAAGQVIDNTRNYSEVELSYSLTDGNFHRPQQGAALKSFNVGCEGFVDLTDAFVWGEFSFEQRDINGSRFNASIIDPFRGMPYFMADDRVSDWRNQYYSMRFRASTPLYRGKIAFGIEGAYRAAIGAKQLDPRVDSRYFQLELLPAVVWQIDRRNTLGADFRYSPLKEDARMMNVNVSLPQTYYMLYGLGVATKNIGDGEDLNYHGHILGFGLQYNLRHGIADILAQVDYAHRVENLDRSFTDPKKDAGVNDKIWKYSVTAHFRADAWSNHLTLEGHTRKVKGVQYINVFDNTEDFNGWVDIARNVRSIYRSQTLAASYSLLRDRGEEYTWRMDAGLEYTKLDDEYILPYSFRNSENIHADIAFKYNIAIGKELRRRLLVGVGGGFNSNLSGEYSYGGVNEDYPTVTELETGDRQYLTSDWYNLKASVEYSRQFSMTQKMNFFLRALFDYVKTSSYGFNHRSNLTLAIGVNF